MVFLFGAGPILVLTVDKGVTSNPYKPRIHFVFFHGLGESCAKQDAPLMHAQRFLKHVGSNHYDQGKCLPCPLFQTYQE